MRIDICLLLQSSCSQETFCYPDQYIALLESPVLQKLYILVVLVYLFKRYALETVSPSIQSPNGISTSMLCPAFKFDKASLALQTVVSSDCKERYTGYMNIKGCS